MAGEPVDKKPEGAAPTDPTKAPAQPNFTTEIAGSDGGSMEAGDEDTFRESEAEGVSAEFNTETGEMLGDIEEPHEEGDTEAKPDDAADGGEGDGTDEPHEEANAELEETLPALPAFDADNAEVKAQYDARYFPEGKLNRSLLSQEFWKGLSKVPEGEAPKDHGYLSEETYKYLQVETGMSLEDIHDYEAGLVARQKLQQVEGNTALVQRIQQVEGGVPAFTAAVNWAKGEKGYTAEQKARWNAIYAKGPSADLDDALDALMTRYRKANPEAGGPQNGNRRTRNQRRRQSTPQRTSDGAAVVPRGQAPAVAPEGFIKRADYETKFNDAYAAKQTAIKSKDIKGEIAATKALDDLARMKNQRKVIP